VGAPTRDEAATARMSKRRMVWR